MGLNARNPIPPEANPNVALRPVIILEYWPPIEGMHFEPGSVILAITVKGKNHAATAWTGRTEDVIHGSIRVLGEKDAAGTENYVFKIDDLKFHEAASDAVWKLQADLLVDGVKLHQYEFPCIYVHGGKLPPNEDEIRALQHEESQAKEEFRDRLTEVKDKLTHFTHRFW